MTVHADVDIREFQRSLARYVAVSKKAFPQILNAKAKRLAYAAARETRKADRASILALGVTYTTVGKRGKLLKKAKGVYTPTTRFMGIFIASLKAKGISIKSKFVNKTALLNAAKKALAKRVQGIGHLASGWLFAARELVGKSENVGIKTFGKPKGWARPALPEWKSSALIANSAEPVTKNERARVIIEEGLRKALRSEADDMEKYVADKLNGLKP